MRFNVRERLVLILGDVVALAGALWLALFVRYAEIPSWELVALHFTPFSFLFLASICVFFVSGLYEKHTSLLKRELPATVLSAQAVNVAIAVAFFFFIPDFGIAPKTNLILYTAISSLMVVVWRLRIFPFFEFRERGHAIAIGAGKELEALVEEVNANRRYHLEFVDVFDISKVTNPNDIQQAVLKRVIGGSVRTIVADTHGKYADMLVPLFYNLTFVQSHVEVIPFARLYEEVFDRVPLSELSHEWLMMNTESRSVVYPSVKRAIDLFCAAVLLLVLAVLTPFIFLALRLEGTGPLFITQERIGKNGKKIRVLKLRSMTANENGAWVGETHNRVTRVGAFLRVTSLDEIPQALAILKGDLSLIGPRSDVSGLAERLAEAIPFYNARYRVVPGISGWAQINQRYAPGNISPQSIEESRARLAYDLYYVKHRSLLLDVSIVARTIKTLIVRILSYGR